MALLVQAFHNTQFAALGAMSHYCEWTPKFHQWLHMGRPIAKHKRPKFLQLFICFVLCVLALALALLLWG